MSSSTRSRSASGRSSTVIQCRSFIRAARRGGGCVRRRPRRALQGWAPVDRPGREAGPALTGRPGAGRRRPRPRARGDRQGSAPVAERGSCGMLSPPTWRATDPVAPAHGPSYCCQNCYHRAVQATRARMTKGPATCIPAGHGPFTSGGWEIRTPEGFHPTRFPNAPTWARAKPVIGVLAVQRVVRTVGDATGRP